MTESVQQQVQDDAVWPHYEADGVPVEDNAEPADAGTGHDEDDDA